MELVLQQNQKLQLVMTAELKKAVALLQYSTVDLYNYIAEQEVDNPLIELGEKGNSIPVNKSNSTDTGYSNPIDFVAATEKNEREKLLEYINYLDLEQNERYTLRYLILNLDENGYLRLTNEEMLDQLGEDKEFLERSISLLQKLEPIGVGARDLSECLLIQLRHYYPEEKVAEIIVRDHLEKLADKKWHDIAKYLDISLLDVQEAYYLVQTLNPRPCNLNLAKVEYIYPDVIIEEFEGTFKVYLNDDYLPDIGLNLEYFEMLKTSGAGKFLQENYNKYKMLLNSIEQRKKTILKVTEAVIRRQQDFFMEGFAALKPLTLKEIADQIDMHESTVSRATANKVVQTPKGNYDFRIFFTSKLKGDNGNSESQAKVKLLLEQLIKNEDKQRPYSDQEIAEHFKMKEGITISRRTVAKYRSQLNILPSSKRKEIKI